MIIGVGLDVLEVDRIRRVLARWGNRFLQRLLMPSEVEYCRRHKDVAPYVAVRIAAKEAFFKATGMGLSKGMAWRQVVVERDAHGKPSLKLTGRAADVMKELRADAVHLTLSHADTIASAVVILEKK
jgi:holo-[acyl-carrier protein] synthase